MDDGRNGKPGETLEMGAFWELVGEIGEGELSGVETLVLREPGLVAYACETGATRAEAARWFVEALKCYVYAGDTGLHLAAAGYRVGIVALLLERGAGVTARNRLGATPLHHACTTNIQQAADQVATIRLLAAHGADLEALDKQGTGPLHRAVRTRGADAVGALLALGASPHLPNGNGSTPLHLAVQNTGRGGTGNPEAQAEQGRIITHLLCAGADPEARDGRGRTVRDVARQAWVRDLLDRS